MDSGATNGWQGNRTPDNDPCLCQSVGFLIGRGKKGLTLARDADVGNEATGGWMTIPLSCVVKVRRLK